MLVILPQVCHQLVLIRREGSQLVKFFLRFAVVIEQSAVLVLYLGIDTVNLVDLVFVPEPECHFLIESLLRLFELLEESLFLIL